MGCTATYLGIVRRVKLFPILLSDRINAMKDMRTWWLSNLLRKFNGETTTGITHKQGTKETEQYLCMCMPKVS